jgi:hypothetical protein
MLAASDVAISGAVAAVAAFAGAVLTYLGTVHTSRAKAREMELEHRLKRSDAHVLAAQQHLEDVYLPISAALSQLARTFENFKWWSEQEGLGPGGRPDEQDEAAKHFATAIVGFTGSVNRITAEGREAYLTADLDTRLRGFVTFLERSEQHYADQSIPPGVLMRPRGIVGADAGKRYVEGSRWFDGHESYASHLKTHEVVYAHIGTDAFADRFNADVEALKRLLRDVTLGPVQTGTTTF